METVVVNHQNSQLVSVEQVTRKFEEMLPEFLPEGGRFQHFLSAFSGKDLLWAMNSWCVANGFISAWSFREKILKGITGSRSKVWEWLPEWLTLRQVCSRIMLKR